ncbi:hypothetical protein CHLRE_06g253102v5 [Chlamydomonas reinhardtii]|uniref:Uncharacterized protein n=1 Tax=Chlamydomonas reinhardtii TaxID=3055 RepID=A0A2K3DM29_CHLRE|nr:uncharacterized protein CHLRE_06g253102v5 [Chlamydomonas reinhardtii]PNW81596.1 hypothetical protein CHLRE_06g253102v5 [Chlamydomonas reinhardtii]
MNPSPSSHLSPTRAFLHASICGPRRKHPKAREPIDCQTPERFLVSRLPHQSPQPRQGRPQRMNRFRWRRGAAVGLLDEGQVTHAERVVRRRKLKLGCLLHRKGQQGHVSRAMPPPQALRKQQPYLGGRSHEIHWSLELATASCIRIH